MNYLKRASDFVWKEEKLFFIYMMLIKVFQGFIPYLSLLVVAGLINNVQIYVTSHRVDFNIIILLLSLQFLIAVIDSILTRLEIVVSSTIEQRVEYKLKQRILGKVIDIQYKNFEDHKFYNYLQRSQGDLGSRFFQPINTLLDIFKVSITVVTVFVYLFSFHWLFPLLSLLSAVPMYFFQKYYGMKKFYLMKYQTPSAREHNYIFSLMTSRESNKEIRIFVIGDYLKQKWAKLFSKNNEEIIGLITKHQRVNIFLDIFTAFIYAASTFVILELIFKGLIKIGDFVSIGQGIKRAQVSINILTNNIASLYEKQLFIKDYYFFLHYADNVSPKNKIKQNHKMEGKWEVYFKNASYNYPYSSKASINNINLTISSGEKIAIVGENGSGKSTLIKCLVGLYDLSDGEVLINGSHPSLVHDKISVIFQDFGKYDFSVKENIGFGRISKINEPEIIKQAAMQAEVHKLIDTLESKYDTRLGRMFENSTDLSGGQWQKIALARALVSDAKIIVLDEPTSSLDPVTEAEIFKNFKTIIGTKTTIFISHRMYASQYADRIVVMKDGQIVESGTHLELIDIDGEYKRLYSLQANMYSSEKNRQEVLMT
ncbi:putative ABC transport system ATP-binding protein [Cytobacillus firmus]|uniref:Putative ABC transport system ATP-binding protein n=2 Tax=Cytobacillus TaxID=2675230 RepID=A0A366JHS7_CYTFI|nr:MULTISPECIES: ABC transporter ATP-binding protein [Cytobacillus]RBP86584.1 putative ABC transport system ATP-binding protein [Cytobacillus firmus]TDX39324.1 putative ABC transport system ATP-binding protein [Cytobacillus oceanisediminis]